MGNYKIVIFLILFIITGLFIGYQQMKISELEKKDISNQIVISDQENKIKEQIGLISILESDSLTKNVTIFGLQELIESNKTSCQETMDKLTELGLITSDFSEIEDAENFTKEKKIINDESKETDISVVDTKVGKRFIELRNSVIRNYR